MRSRNFVFTLNNYTPEDEERIKRLKARYIVYGREIAPTTQTPHLQGYVCFPNGKTVAAARTLLAGCHVEVARGRHEQCITYCKKDGDFWELGVAPIDPADKGARERQRWESAWSAAVAGQIEEIDPQIRVTHWNKLRSIASHYSSEAQTLDNVAGVWLYGQSGAGKTQAVRDRFPGCYNKMANKWWDGYDVTKPGHKVAYLDDIDPQHASWIPQFLKLWGDKHPFRGEAKGTSINIRPAIFIVTSQYRLSDMQFRPEDLQALQRRYIEIEKVKLGAEYIPIVWPDSRIANIPVEPEVPVVELSEEEEGQEEEHSIELLEDSLQSIEL